MPLTYLELTLIIICIFLVGICGYLASSLLEEKGKNALKRIEQEQPISIPTAEDAKFLRMQVRNPSWKKVYKAINKAISKGEDHCEIKLYECEGDAIIPMEELREELGALGYKVEIVVSERWFSVKWG